MLTRLRVAWGGFARSFGILNHKTPRSAQTANCGENLVPTPLQFPRHHLAVFVIKSDDHRSQNGDTVRAKLREDGSLPPRDSVGDKRESDEVERHQNGQDLPD
jgi:hypothetical protein